MVRIPAEWEEKGDGKLGIRKENYNATAPMNTLGRHFNVVTDHYPVVNLLLSDITVKRDLLVKFSGKKWIWQGQKLADHLPLVQRCHQIKIRRERMWTGKAAV